MTMIETPQDDPLAIARTITDPLAIARTIADLAAAIREGQGVPPVVEADPVRQALADLATVVIQTRADLGALALALNRAIREP